MAGLAARLDEIEEGTGEDWLRQRDQELGRALRPSDQPQAGLSPPIYSLTCRKIRHRVKVPFVHVNMSRSR